MRTSSSKLWIIAGSISVGMGILGIFLPILPTTPFLLLAAFCYSRGSKTLYRKLLNQSILGGYIRDYQEGLGVPLRQKIISITFLWLTISASIVLIKPDLWLSLFLFVVAVSVTVHLVKIKTKIPENISPVTDTLPDKPMESNILSNSPIFSYFSIKQLF